MRAGFYWNYAARSLRRGGQRTVLAIFCIAVGVMAIVALQLATLMISNNLTGNVQAANGGDISVRQDVNPFRAADLAFFAALQRQGKLTGWTAVTDDQGTITYGTHTYPATIGVVDPAHYPLVGGLDIAQPAGGDLHRLLAAPDAAVLSRAAATNLNVGLGARVLLTGGGGRSLTVRVVGLLGTRQVSEGVDAYVQRASYAGSSSAPLTYNVVYITTTDDAQTNATVALIKNRYPLATVETVADVLKQRQDQVNQIHQLLQVIGILALLIGGFGVVNTMNVLLARRRIEIAMLKTAGYRRRDLYALFGLEAALLGVVGGVVGALVGILLSWGVKTLIENAFLLQLPFVVDPLSVGMGVVVGFCTALIFGLLPIVRAAMVRPQAVLRDVPERRSWGTRLGSAGLFLLLSILFCVLASVILGSALVGIIVVYGTFVILGLLSLVFGAVVLLIGRLPVPERPTVAQVLLSTVALLIGVALAVPLPTVGAIVVLAALAGYAVPFLPRTWKATIKMSLRDVGRQRTRATMTLLSLFVGVFSIGLIVVLGQDVQAKINDAVANGVSYNVYSLVPAALTGRMNSQLRHLPGLKGYQAVNGAAAVPVAVNGQPIAAALRQARTSRRAGPGNLGTDGTLEFLSGFTGYNLAQPLPDTTVDRGNGRTLGPADTGTTNVLLPVILHTLRPLRLPLGARITLTDQQGTATLTVRAVGFYNVSLFGGTRYPILAAHGLVHRFGGPNEQYIYSLKVDPAKADAAVAQLNGHVPGALTINLTSLLGIVDQILGNLVTLLVALASMALFAGVIIIANAVALAMLERRREQGILKSVGYTSRRVLAGVLVENGVIGGLGGVLGMILVALATGVLARTLFKTSLDVPGLTTLELIVLVTVIALITAALVSWRAVRVRPLEVLRYE